MIFRSKNQRTKKIVLIVSLAGNLGLLGFFKYADFAIAQFNFFGQILNLGTAIPLLHLALPIAISFYTFHSITYTVTIYRGQMAPVKSFTEYAIFVAFFPQLVAGPILRAKEFLPQLREKINGFTEDLKLRQLTIEPTNLKFGITLMTLGFFKKIFFADNISPMVNQIFQDPVGSESLTIFLGAVSFGIQIYCDFSGYTDIAIGAARILGFTIPINFNKPYFATSPSDFWRRWHISLSTWLRDYLYKPLGGNRKSKPRTYLNLMIVMFLGGLWHGASWNFIIWGVLHGAYLMCHKALCDIFPTVARNKFFKSKVGIIFSILVTQYLVFLTWIAFRVENTQQLIYSLNKFIFFDFLYKETFSFILAHHKSTILIIGVFFILHFISYKKKELPLLISNLRGGYWIIFEIIIISLVLFFYGGNSQDFIYFQF